MLTINFEELPAEVKRAVALRCDGKYGTYNVLKDGSARSYIGWVELLRGKNIYTNELDDLLFSHIFDTIWPLSLKNRALSSLHKNVFRFNIYLYNKIFDKTTEQAEIYKLPLSEIIIRKLEKIELKIKNSKKYFYTLDNMKLLIKKLDGIK